jgi:hypothetical protein
MVLTRDFRRSIVERVRREPAFAEAMLDEVLRFSSTASRRWPVSFSATS